jgi:REP element-mobilizing transposase RayT
LAWAGVPVGAKNFSPLPGTSKTIGSIVRGCKIGVTKWFKENLGTGEVWQRNYYEPIIRDDESLNRIREYIRNNPMRWAFDEENPTAIEMEPVAAWLK